MDDRIPWTGDWPGTQACIEFGWFAKCIPGKTGWQPCGADEPDATPDLNRLYVNAAWDRKGKRFVKKQQ